MSSSAPLPRSSTTIAPCRCAACATATGSGASVNPDCTKFDGWTRSTIRARPSARAAAKSSARVRFVVPTSTRRRTGPADDLGDPDAAADLDQLAARHGDAAASPGQAHGKGECRGVVVRDQRVLRARQLDEQLLRRAIALAAAARRPIQLQEERRPRGALRGHDRRSRPRRAAKVRVDDHAGRVDDRERAAVPRPQLFDHDVRQRTHVAWLGTRPERGALVVDDGPRNREDRRLGMPRVEGRPRGGKHPLNTGRTCARGALGIRTLLVHARSIAMGAVGPRWVPWSSKPVARRQARRGGFDSHALPPGSPCSGCLPALSSSPRRSGRYGRLMMQTQCSTKLLSASGCRMSTIRL